VRTEILDATARLLDGAQLHEVSVENISQEAGISRPTFYSYFASKLEIVLELYQLAAAEMYSAVTPLWNRPEDQTPPGGIRQGIPALADAWVPRRAVFQAAFELRYVDPEMMSTSERTVAHFASNIGAQLDADRTAGIAPAGPPAGPLVTTLLWSSEHALYIASRGLSDDLPNEYAVIVPLQAMWLGALYGTIPTSS
jgi:AcrR family transcriptional regulator